MGKLIMILATVIAVFAVGVRNIHYKKLLSDFKVKINEINSHYIYLFKEKSGIERIFQVMLIILAQVFMAFNVTSGIGIHLRLVSNTTINFIIKYVMVLVLIFAVYLAVGYVLLSSSKIFKIINKVEDSNIKYDLLISYFLLNTYFTVLIVFPKQFEECYQIGLVGVAICYILNLRILIKIIRNPKYINIDGENFMHVTSTAMMAILILIIVILNLFIAVCFVNKQDINAYSGNPSNFDLFYYTMITFTTIGYGDIVPATTLSKIVGIIISTTSVVCITIFLSALLSYRNDYGYINSESKEEENIKKTE